MHGGKGVVAGDFLSTKGAKAEANMRMVLRDNEEKTGTPSVYPSALPCLKCNLYNIGNI